MDSYTLRFIEGKKLTQDQLIPAIIMLIVKGSNFLIALL